MHTRNSRRRKRLAPRPNENTINTQINFIVEDLKNKAGAMISDTLMSEIANCRFANWTMTSCFGLKFEFGFLISHICIGQYCSFIYSDIHNTSRSVSYSYIAIFILYLDKLHS